MNFYAILSSNDSPDFFDNKPWNFRVLLPNEIQLTVRWSVALMELSMESCSKSKQSRNLCLCLAGCSGSIVSGRNMNLPRKVYLRNKASCNIIYRRSYYVKKMTLGSLRHVHLEAFVDNFQPAKFLNQNVMCTLHFRQDGV